LQLAGWVANCIDPDMPVLQENIYSLAARIPAPCLGVVPWLENAAPESVANALDPESLAHFFSM
jgi:dethiobiotin synthetase